MNDITKLAGESLAELMLRPMKALIVEDDLAVRLMMQAFLQSLGHDVVLAEDGEQAVVQFERHAPDLVLMDIIMPQMDGVEATRAIRQRGTGHWVPIIVLSGLSRDEEVVRALAAGADDFVGKPVNLAILRAKIDSMRRIATMQRRLENSERALAKYQADAESELQLAIGVIGKMVDREGLKDPQLRWKVRPAGRFSGDVVAALRAPSGALYVMLADATGHGLTAAISLFPALNVFYGMARKGLGVDAVIREMNSVLKSSMPVGRYLAAQVCRLDEDARRAELWNGGMPYALMVNEDGVTPFASRNMPLGILDNATLDARCELLNWTQPGQIFLFSDGLVEAENEQGEAFGYDTLLGLLGVGPRASCFDAVTEALTQHLGAMPAHDDISLVKVELP